MERKKRKPQEENKRTNAKTTHKSKRLSSPCIAGTGKRSKVMGKILTFNNILRQTKIYKNKIKFRTVPTVLD